MNSRTELISEPVESKAARTRKLVETAIEDLAGALDRGRSDTLKRYLSLMARFHRYSAGNLLLIWSQRPDATHVAGFNKWKELGRSVRRGQRGILILAPMIGRRVIPKGNEEEEEERLYGFRTAHVFDVSQTDGKELPEFAVVKGDPGVHLERLKDAIQRNGIRLTVSNDLGSAFGRSRGGEISVRPGLATAEEFSVLVHEFAHELLHHGADRGATTRTIRETEAEAVAFVVCQAVGLETGTASSDYIQLYDGKKETLQESLARIQETAQEILGGLLQPPLGHRVIGG